MRTPHASAPGGGIPTPAQRRRVTRHLNRRIKCRHGAARVLQQMRRGATLHLHHERGHRFWALSTGARVAPGIAALVIADTRVAPSDDSLFRDLPSQTWRYAND